MKKLFCKSCLVFAVPISLMVATGAGFSATPQPKEASAASRAAAAGAKDLFLRQLNERGDQNFGIEYSIELTRDGTTYKVDSSFPFQSGDQIRFHVKTNRDGYLQILLTEGSSGKSARLFPAESLAESGKVQAGEAYTVPEKATLTFDDTPGEEHLRLVLSKKPVLGAKQLRGVEIVEKSRQQWRAQGNTLVSFNRFNDCASEADFTKPAVTAVSTDVSKPLTLDLVLSHRRRAVTTSDSSTVAMSAPSPSQDGHPVLEARVTANSPVKDKWALVIGISKFRDPRLNLMFPAKDAQDFARFLTNDAHFARDHVKVLANQQASRANILTELGHSWLPHNVAPGDLVVIYAATHGTSAERDVARKNFLVAYDTDALNPFATGIEMQDFLRTIKRRLNTDRILLVLDTCHAGAADGGKSAWMPPRLNMDEVMQGSGQLIIASSKADQTAHDSKRYQNGIFTKHLIDGLRQFPDLKNAFSYAKAAVEAESAKDFGKPQTPVMKEVEWNGSALRLKVPPAEPRKAK